jgi:hypothetical protein
VAVRPPSCDIRDSSELAGDFGGGASSLMRRRIPRGGTAGGSSGFGFDGGEKLAGDRGSCVEGDRASECAREIERARGIRVLAWRESQGPTGIGRGGLPLANLGIRHGIRQG